MLNFESRQVLRSKLAELFTDRYNLEAGKLTVAKRQQLTKIDREIEEIKAQLRTGLDWTNLVDIILDVDDSSQAGLLDGETEIETIYWHLENAKLEHEQATYQNQYCHRLRVNGVWSPWRACTIPIVFNGYSVTIDDDLNVQFSVLIEITASDAIKRVMK